MPAFQTRSVIGSPILQQSRFCGAERTEFSRNCGARIRATGSVSYAPGRGQKIFRGSSLRLGRSRANDDYRRIKPTQSRREAEIGSLGSNTPAPPNPVNG